MPRFAIIILFVCSLSVYFLFLSKTDIYILDEVKNAVCAHEMLNEHDLFVPTFNNSLRTDKPPLHYFFMELGYSIFGYNELGARFFSGVAGILLIFLTFYYTGILLGKKTAWLASLVLLSSTFTSIQFRLAVPDPYLILLIFLALIHLYLYLERNGNIVWFYFYVALAFLAKGLVAIIFPLLVFVAYLLITKTFTLKNILAALHWKGIIIFFLIACPWFIYVGIKTEGAWLSGFFIDHHINRFLETREGHRGFPGLAIIYSFISLLPFGVWLVPALLRKKSFWLNHTFLLFALVSALVIILFFSFSRTLLPSYVAPSIPFLSIILGYWLNSKQVLKRKFVSRLGISLLILISIGIPIGVLFSIQKEIPGDLNLTYRSFSTFLLPIGAFTTLYFYMNRKRWKLIYGVFVTWFLFNISLHVIILPALVNKNAVRSALNYIDTIEKGNTKEIIAYKNFNPAFVWYKKEPIKLATDSSKLYEMFLENKSNWVVTKKSYEEELKKDKSLMKVFSQKELFEKGEVIVYKKR